MLRNFDAERLTDLGQGSELGPPVVVPLRTPVGEQWLCVAGNLRVILVQLAALEVFAGAGRRIDEEALADYAESLRVAAQTLGLCGPHGGASLLVRVLSDQSLSGHPVDDRLALTKLAEINRQSDAAFTRSKDIASVGYTYARGLLELLESADDHAAETTMRRLRERVLSSRGFQRRRPAWARRLITDLMNLGIIPLSEENMLLRSDRAGVTDIGTRYARHIVSSLAFDDPDLVDEVPKAVVPRLLAATPLLLRVVGMGEWDIRGAVAAGARFLRRPHMTGAPRKAQFLQWQTKISASTLHDDYDRALAAMETPRQQLLFALPTDCDPESDADERTARAWAAILLFGAGREAKRFRLALAEWAESAPTHAGGLPSLFGPESTGATSPPAVSQVFGDGIAALQHWLDKVIPATTTLAERRVAAAAGTAPSEAQTLLAYAWQHGAEALFDAAVGAWPRLVTGLIVPTYPQGLRGRASRYSYAQWFAYAVVRNMCWKAQKPAPLHGGPSDRQIRRMLLQLRALHNGRLWAALCAAAPVLRDPPRRGRRPRRDVTQAVAEE